MDPLGIGLGLILAVTVIVSLATVGRLREGGSRLLSHLRSRFVLGVPFGSLVVIAFVFSIYLFVQDGITNFEEPVVIPFRAWSYYYPLGMVTGSFTHASSGHLLSNLFGAAVVAPIAEYAWGHYPSGRDDHETTSIRTNPWARALFIFPLTVLLVGFSTSLFALGPVIGFSGVVFAFMGFAIVRYPITTIVAIIGGQTVLMTTYRALVVPVGVYVAQPSPPTAPSWANIAIQGHALGFLVGFLLGVALLRRRNYRPDPLALWIAILLFGFTQGLWQIYWFGGQNEFILFQGPGIVIVTALALVVTVAATATRKPLLPARVRKRVTTSRAVADEIRTNLRTDRILELAGSRRDDTAESGERVDDSSDSFERIGSIARGSYPRESGILATISQRQTAVVAVLVVLAMISGPAVPVNLFFIEGESGNDDGIVIEDYTVQYAEGVENEMVGVVDVAAFGQDTTVESNGVIVSSEQRHLWEEAVTAQQLAFSGEETVHVGGVGWRETVHVERDGWVPTGHDPVYRVWLSEEGGEERLAYTSEGSQSDVRIGGHTVALEIEDGEYVLELEPAEDGADSEDGNESTIDGGNESTADTEDDAEPVRVPLPEEGERVTAGNVAFEQESGVIVAVWGDTAVRVATEETYDGGF